MVDILKINILKGLTLTQSTGDFGETKKINNTYEFVYVNENELNYDGEIYKWQKSFDGK